MPLAGLLAYFRGSEGNPRLERVALWAGGSLTDPGPRWPREQPAPCRPPVCRRLLLRAGMEQHQQVYPSFLVGSPRTCPGFIPHLPGLCSPGRFLGWQEPSKRPLVPVGSTLVSVF